MGQLYSTIPCAALVLHPAISAIHPQRHPHFQYLQHRWIRQTAFPRPLQYCAALYSFINIFFLFFFSLYFSFFYRSFLPHIDCFAAWTRQAKFSFELFLYRFILFHFFSHVVPFHPVPSINPSLDIAWRFLTAMHRTAPYCKTRCCRLLYCALCCTLSNSFYALD